MNVLVINGSPKGEHSNTMQLTRSFLEGAGWKDAEILEVSKAGIKACLGCFACWNKTPGTCVIEDGMRIILPKLIAADIIIWSFPLYYYGIPGDMKTLIDRQLPLNLPFMAGENESGGHPSRYDLSQQRHVAISTCGFWTAHGNYDAVTAMFHHYYGNGDPTEIFCGQGELFRIPELKSRTAAYLELVRNAGAEYAAGGISAETMDALSKPLYPREVFEKMADASWGLDDSAKTAGDDSLNFTIQMAALYMPDGRERIVEFSYTDIGKTYQLLLTKQGSEVISENFREYTTKIETPYSVWRSIARGEISGQDALFQQQYRVLGDFDLMLKWEDLFGAQETEKGAKLKPQRKTDMTVLLAPWIVIWIAIAINPTIGGAAGILVSAALPLLWFFFQPVLYEQITIPLVAALSLMALLGIPPRIVVPVSYAAFGFLWLAGSFLKTPLTAHYSAANYGNEKAFDNPLFIRTNRILTAAWAVLYLITPIWTYFLMGTALSTYIGLINSICPALMGLFTAWFQKWYPARFARG
ncbi:MAG: flavodoxin family protein [Lachnospiraceae bacterium]